MNPGMLRAQNSSLGTSTHPPWRLCVAWREERPCESMILLMEEILHQLINSLSHYAIIYRVLCIPGGAGCLPSKSMNETGPPKFSQVHLGRSPQRNLDWNQRCKKNIHAPRWLAALCQFWKKKISKVELVNSFPDCEMLTQTGPKIEPSQA